MVWLFCWKMSRMQFYHLSFKANYVPLLAIHFKMKFNLNPGHLTQLDLSVCMIKAADCVTPLWPFLMLFLFLFVNLLNVFLFCHVRNWSQSSSTCLRCLLTPTTTTWGLWKMGLWSPMWSFHLGPNVPKSLFALIGRWEQQMKPETLNCTF